MHGSYASRHRDQVHALDMLAATSAASAAWSADIVALDEAPAAFGRDPRRRGAQGRRRAVADGSSPAARCATRSPRGCATAVVDGRARARATGCPSRARAGPRAWASRARSLRAAIALLEEEGFVRRRARLGHLRHATGRCCATTSSRNFGVSSMIASMGLEPGTVDETLRRRAAPRRGRRRARRRAGRARERAAARAHRGRPAGGRHRSTGAAPTCTRRGERPPSRTARSTRRSPSAA